MTAAVQRVVAGAASRQEDAARTERRARVRLLVLIGATAALAALAVTAVGDGAAPVQGWRLTWWALTPMFVLSEALGVNLHFRHSAHTFTLSELPLVLGLFFAD